MDVDRPGHYRNRDEAVRKSWCPACGVRPGQSCTYLMPKTLPERDPQYGARAQYERLARVRNPTRVPHIERMQNEAFRMMQWLRANGDILWAP